MKKAYRYNSTLKHISVLYGPACTIKNDASAFQLYLKTFHSFYFIERCQKIIIII